MFGQAKNSIFFFIKEELLFIKEATTTITMKGYFFLEDTKKTPRNLHDKRPTQGSSE